MAWSSAVYSFYSDVEPLCSRKLYLVKTVSFFPKDIHRTRRANNYSFLLCASLKVVILLKQACHGHFNVNRRDSNCIKTTTCEMKHYNLQLYREQGRNFHWPSSAAFKISFIKSNRQVLYLYSSLACMSPTEAGKVFSRRVLFHLATLRNVGIIFGSWKDEPYDNLWVKELELLISLFFFDINSKNKRNNILGLF